MRIGTDSGIAFDLLSATDPIWRRQQMGSGVGPVVFQYDDTTLPHRTEVNDGKLSSDSGVALKRVRVPVANESVLRHVQADTTPLEVWEGTVISVDREAELMHVVLDAKVGGSVRHTAEIALDEVSEQDRDLIVDGAVFYLTLYKLTVPSVENRQELRFRRRPSWSEAQVRQIDQDASEFLAKMKPLPSAV